MSERLGPEFNTNSELPSISKEGSLSVENTLGEMKKRQAEEFLAGNSVDDEYMTLDDITDIHSAARYWKKIRPTTTRPVLEDLEEACDEFISYEALKKLGGLKALRQVIEDKEPPVDKADRALPEEPITPIEEAPEVAKEYSRDTPERRYRYSPAPVIFPEELDEWEDIETWEDVDKLWLNAVESLRTDLGDEKANIQPSLQNLNLAAKKFGCIPAGEINARFKNLGGLSEFQRRHGYTEPDQPPKEPWGPKRPPETQKQKQELIKAAHLWIERHRNVQLNSDSIQDAFRQGSFFDLETIDSLGGLNRLKEEVDFLIELSQERPSIHTSKSKIALEGTKKAIIAEEIPETPQIIEEQEEDEPIIPELIETEDDLL